LGIAVVTCGEAGQGDDAIGIEVILDLPPIRLVLLRPETLPGGRVSETLRSRMADYLDAVTQAVEHLERCI
jgi:hypothetical protein